MRIMFVTMLLAMAGCESMTMQGLHEPDKTVVMTCSTLSHKVCERRNGRLTRCWCQDRSSI